MSDPIRIPTGEPNKAQDVAKANDAFFLRMATAFQRWFFHAPVNNERGLGKHSEGKKFTRLARDRQLDKRRTKRKMAAASRRINR